MLVIDGVKYKLWTPKDEEKEFHPMIREHSKEIFGENSLYLPIEKRLVSKTGRGVIPDGFAIIFSKTPEIYFVEVELSKHDLDKHIVEQLNRFGRAIKNPKNQKMIADRLHKEIKSNLVKEAFFKQMIDSKEIYKFLSDLVSQSPKILIIIEHKDDRVVEACEGLKISPEIREFKTFAREDAPNVRAHLIEPLIEEGEEEEEVHACREKRNFYCNICGKEDFAVGEINEHLRDEHGISLDEQVIEGWDKRFEKLMNEYFAKKGEGKYPPHRTSWEKRLEWVSPSVNTLVAQLISQIEKEFPDVNHLPKYRWYYIYKGKIHANSLFVVLMLKKKEIKVRIRTEPRSFKDEKNWTKSYKGWFFKEGQEREFKITDKEQTVYALELIRQSYETTQPITRRRSIKEFI